MGYSDQINILKEALNGYSAEENKLSELYKTAIANAEKAHAEKQKQLDGQYYRDRNEVYADSARDERNLNSMLAARGLGFSGEAAQAKLNSNITLNNRLGELTREKNAASLEYDLELANNKSKLSMEQADKLKELLNSKNQLNADIAAMELERETGEAERAAEKEAAALKLQAEKDANAAKIAAEKELQAEKLAAEKDMLDAELRAKYYASGRSGSNGSGGSNGSDTAEEAVEGYIPDITAKELAKQLISSATDNNQVNSEAHEYMVNKYLLELKDSYDINEDYYNELVFMLKAYGYEEITEPEMRTQVISYDAKAYYDNMYDDLYNRFVVAGVKEGSARNQARSIASEQQLAYIYKHCENITEFKICCNRLGIAASTAQEYINRINSKKASVSGSAGGGNSYTARQTK